MMGTSEEVHTPPREAGLAAAEAFCIQVPALNAAPPIAKLAFAAGFVFLAWICARSLFTITKQEHA